MDKPKKLKIGASDFKEIIDENAYFIDKSLLIEEVIDSGTKILLLPRPRRFGKTLNLSMLRYYFDIAQHENLFTELAVWQCDNEIKEKRGKFPVIYMSFKDTKANNWNDCYELIQNEIYQAYKQHRYLLEGDTLYSEEKEMFNHILTKTANRTDFAESIKRLSEYLHRYYNQNTVILIDEYDAPIQSGYKNYYEEVVSFMRNLLSGAFKDNQYLYKGVITGILRVSKESIFSGLNNISVHSVLDDEFSDKFGFTENEVKQVLSDFNVKTEYREIKKWYDGYKIGETENLYNPWSILNFTASKNETFKTYWANTSTDELIKKEIKKKDADYIRQDLLSLIGDSCIVKDLEANFVFPDLNQRKSLLWTLLTYSGYLTVNKQVSRKTYELTIPNYEIKAIFQDTVIEWMETDLKVIKSRLEETTNYLVTNQINNFERGFRQIMGDTFSYFDTGANPEFVYQSYVLGLLAIIGDDYVIKSNRESGEGRYDIMLIPRSDVKTFGETSQPYGIVIEIKQTERKSDNETDEQFANRINAMLADALQQIESKQYYKELIDNKIAKDKIIKLPIVFAGKTPYITRI